MLRGTLALGLVLGCAATLVGCPDPPPPAPYQQPLPHQRPLARQPKRLAPPPTAAEAPPLSRPVRKVEDPMVVARRECEEVYRLRERAHGHMRRLLAKRSPKTVVPKMPPREQFVANCTLLPLDVIRCMNPQKAARMGVACVATLSKLDAKALERLRKASKGKGKGRRRRRR